MMQRRTFFGVFGTIAAFLGMKSEAKSQVSALPVVKFDEKGKILNLDEIFKNSIHYRVVPDGWSDPDFWLARAYLPREYVHLFDVSILHGCIDRYHEFYGPVLLHCFGSTDQISIYRTIDTIVTRKPYVPMGIYADAPFDEDKVLKLYPCHVKKMD